MFKYPEKYRLRDHPILASSTGQSGAFKIPMDKGSCANVLASNSSGWEHVSVHIVEYGHPETPTWDEMCKIKNLFWDEEDCVLQYHPPKSDYVNNHPNVLHLWKPVGIEVLRPPSDLVGIKDVPDKVIQDLKNRIYRNEINKDFNGKKS